MTTITELIPALNQICDEMGLQKKVHVPAGGNPREHGYIAAYQEYKRRVLCNQSK